MAKNKNYKVALIISPASRKRMLFSVIFSFAAFIVGALVIEFAFGKTMIEVGSYGKGVIWGCLGALLNIELRERMASASYSLPVRCAVMAVMLVVAALTPGLKLWGLLGTALGLISLLILLLRRGIFLR